MDAFEPIGYHVKSPPVGGLFAWLGIKNDYRTLVGLDEMDIVVKDDYEDEETDDV